MKKYWQSGMVVVLAIFLTNCKKQTGSVQSAGQEIEKSGKEKMSVEGVDTIFSPNAPSRITRKIRKDHNGNLLIAAFTDVIRYSGDSFSKIPKPDGFESFDAFDALEDLKGNIWIASTHHGVFCYDGEGFRHWTTKEGLVNNRVMDIYEDEVGNIWFGTMGGISCYIRDTFRNFTTAEGLTHNDVNAILADSTGKIWFGTRGALCIYDPLLASFTEVVADDGKSLRNIWSIIEDRKGDVWLAGEDGIWCCANGSLPRRVSNKEGFYLYEDNRGLIWITHKNTLSYFSPETLNTDIPEEVRLFDGESMFFGISEDNKGNIWVGTLQGVFNFDGKSVRYYTENAPSM